MTAQPSLFDQPITLEQAKAGAIDGMARADAHASEDWKDTAYRLALDLPVGHEFMAEDLVDLVRATGATTSTTKAIGPLMRKLAAEGLIQKIGLRPSRVSHCSAKPLWRKVGP